VFGNFHLRLAENVLKMADAKRRLCEQLKDAKTRSITEALVNAYEIHSNTGIY